MNRLAKVSSVLLVLLVCAFASPAERSGEWKSVRDAHLATHPSCEACGARGAKADVDVHHILPVSIWPERELDSTNLITLCNQHHCHLVIGHLGSYSSYNPLAREDAARQLAKVKSRPANREDKEKFIHRFDVIYQNAP